MPSLSTIVAGKQFVLMGRSNHARRVFGIDSEVQQIPVSEIVAYGAPVERGLLCPQQTAAEHERVERSLRRHCDHAGRPPLDMCRSPIPAAVLTDKKSLFGCGIEAS